MTLLAGMNETRHAGCDGRLIHSIERNLVSLCFIHIDGTQRLARISIELDW